MSYKNDIKKLKDKAITFAYDDRLEPLVEVLNTLKYIYNIDFEKEALKISIQNKSINCYEYLVNKGVNLNSHYFNKILSDCNYENLYDIYNLLIKFGFNINESESKEIIIRRLINPNTWSSVYRINLLFNLIDNNFLKIEDVLKIINSGNKKNLILLRELKLRSLGL